MEQRFKLQIEVAFDDESQTKVLSLARRECERGGVVLTRGRGGRQRRVPPTEFIQCVEQALAELAERNPLFSSAGIRIDGLSCGPSTPTEVIQDEENIGEPDEDLDESSTGMYLCRWPNGEFSMVMAESKREAILELDEWDAAEPSWLTPIENCMVDFRLTDEGEIVLKQFGEQTNELIWKLCYPDLDEVRDENVNSGPSGRTLEASAKVLRAVENERKRMWNVQRNPAAAKTELGRELQQRLGASAAVADHYVEQLAAGLLRRKAKSDAEIN